MGKEYDRERGLEPFAKKHLREEVLDFFEGRCCFCGTDLTPSRVCGDHLVPMNKKDLGLDAWGNVVPAATRATRRSMEAIGETSSSNVRVQTQQSAINVCRSS
jgi:hypothetical protein